MKHSATEDPQAFIFQDKVAGRWYSDWVIICRCKMVG